MDDAAALITALSGLVLSIGTATAAVITALRRVPRVERRQAAEQALDESDQESDR